MNLFKNFVQIPVSIENKKALIKWKDIQNGRKKAPTTIEIEKQFKKFRMANICGKLNNIIILDIDKPKIKLDEEGNPKLDKEGKPKKLNDGLKYFKELMKDNDKTLTF